MNLPLTPPGGLRGCLTVGASNTGSARVSISISGSSTASFRNLPVLCLRHACYVGVIHGSDDTMKNEILAPFNRKPATYIPCTWCMPSPNLPQPSNERQQQQQQRQPPQSLLAALSPPALPPSSRPSSVNALPRRGARLWREEGEAPPAEGRRGDGRARPGRPPRPAPSVR